MKPECEQAMERVREVAARLAAGGGDCLRDANSIYGEARRADAWDAEDCDELEAAGAEFLQLGDVLEETQDDPDQRRMYEGLIRQAARALLSGDPFPEWSRD